MRGSILLPDLEWLLRGRAPCMPFSYTDCSTPHCYATTHIWTYFQKHEVVLFALRLAWACRSNKYLFRRRWFGEGQETPQSFPPSFAPVDLFVCISPHHLYWNKQTPCQHHVLRNGSNDKKRWPPVNARLRLSPGQGNTFPPTSRLLKKSPSLSLSISLTEKSQWVVRPALPKSWPLKIPTSWPLNPTWLDLKGSRDPKQASLFARKTAQRWLSWTWLGSVCLRDETCRMVLY